MKKYLPIASSSLLAVTLVALVFYPSASSILGIISLLLSLALSTYAIYTKHKRTEHARAKILKEVGVMVLILIIILFLGGTAAMLANYQVGMRWGELAGLVSAIGASLEPALSVSKGWDTLSAGWGGW
jgi:hypothetical protein